MTWENLIHGEERGRESEMVYQRNTNQSTNEGALASLGAWTMTPAKVRITIAGTVAL